MSGTSGQGVHAVPRDTSPFLSAADDQNISALLQGAAWNGTNITYSFPTSSAQYGTQTSYGNSAPFNGLSQLDSAGHSGQMFEAQRAFHLIASYTNLTFTQITETTTTHATIRLANSLTPSTSFAFTPSTGPRGGDVFYGQTGENPVMGNFDSGQANLHEIGHALGLEHGQLDPGIDPDTYGGMNADRLDIEFSLMNYPNYIGQPIHAGATASTSAQTYMMYDIAALQYMYGANFNQVGHNNVYSWSATSGVESINGAPQEGTPYNGHIFATIWTAGANSTYDLSNFSQNQVDDMNPGGWMLFSSAQLADLDQFSSDPTRIARGNIYNALLYNGDTRSLIKNIVTGSGNDLITGNAADNAINGGAGADTMVGGAGNDTYVVDNGGDQVVENANGGTDTVSASISYALGVNVENLTLTGTSNINGTGNSGNNTITGNSGNNVLDGGSGVDTMAGRAGNDTYMVDNALDVVMENPSEGTDTVNSSVSWTLGNNVENLILTGAAAINGTGNSGDNSISGNGAANVLDGSAGADTMAGGAGNDTYVVDSVFDVVIENPSEGTDTVNSSVGWTLGNNVENLILTGAAAINGTGNSGNNSITGNGAANVLDGSAGVDTMAGGAGDDAYAVDNGGDQVIENANAGSDSVYASIHYRLTANVENLVLQGGADLQGYGNAQVNVLTGNSGKNLLDGDAGADIMIGGIGDDVYYVDNGGDQVTENANEGNDLVFSTAHLRLTANVENLILQGSVDLQGYGNSLGNTLYGNAGNNILDGDLGADAMYGGVGNDVYYVDNVGDAVIENANEGNDVVFSTAHFRLSANVETLVLQGSADLQAYGNSQANTLYGNSGSNILDGDAGVDSMAGGAGNDAYFVDNAGDAVMEDVNAGFDTVFSTIGYTLTANVEQLVLQGSGNLAGTGNALANNIYGNSGNNTLDGGAGADTMAGGAGNDTYFVDNVGDAVLENPNEGTDAVNASVSYALAANVESLTLTGTSNIDGTGNSGSNTITGNAGNNVLDGGAGADTMAGGAGNDAYYVDNGGDAVIEDPNEGNDTVNASIHYRLTANVENLVLLGGADLQGYGNAQVNVLTGNSGSNILDGDVGADTMIGGAGNDVYYVDNGGDQVTENANEGNDLVFSTAHLRLTANVENLILQGSADLQGYGNGLANTLYGNAGNNILDGDAGADGMYGGAGNDVYYVDNAGDVAIENANEGNDVVFSTAHFRLSTNVETLVLQGSADLQGYGNSQANTLYGNSGRNILDGDAGADIMAGGAGDDAYFVDNAGDAVMEGANAGFDTVFSTVDYTLTADVEQLVLQGSGNLAGTGNALANNIYGNSGDNVLDGGAGADALQGGAGNDMFVFNAGQADGDMVLDFAGNDAATGDSLRFVGFGTTAQGASFTQIGASQWQIHSGVDSHNETVTFASAASIDPSNDLVWV